MEAKDKLPEVTILRESILYLGVCAAIPPERAQELPDKVNAITGSPGTTNGRWELIDFKERPEAEPRKCPDHKGRWHYVLEC
jgi:hypothetical protein